MLFINKRFFLLNKTVGLFLSLSIATGLSLGSNLSSTSFQFLSTKFKTVFINRYIDTDYLVVIAKKVKSVPKKDIKLDDYKKVKIFFKDWYKLSQKYKKEIIT